MKCLVCNAQVDSSMVACFERNFCPFCGGSLVSPWFLEQTNKYLDGVKTMALLIGPEMTRVLVNSTLDYFENVGFVPKIQAAEEEIKEAKEVVEEPHISPFDNPVLRDLLQTYSTPIQGEEPAQLRVKKKQAREAIESGQGAFKKLDVPDPDYKPVPQHTWFKEEEVERVLAQEPSSERVWPIESLPQIDQQRHLSQTNIITGQRGVFKRREAGNRVETDKMRNASYTPHMPDVKGEEPDLLKQRKVQSRNNIITGEHGAFKRADLKSTPINSKPVSHDFSKE